MSEDGNARSLATVNPADMTTDELFEALRIINVQVCNTKWGLGELNNRFSISCVRKNATAAEYRTFLLGTEFAEAAREKWEDHLLSDGSLLEDIEGWRCDVSFSSDRLNAVTHALKQHWINKHREVEAALLKAEAAMARLKEHAVHKSDVRDAVWAITDGKCFYCDAALLKTNADCVQSDDYARVFQVDHLVAKDCGGPDHLANYVPACQRCNGSKSSKPFAEFIRSKQAPPSLKVIEGGAA